MNSLLLLQLCVASVFSMSAMVLGYNQTGIRSLTSCSSFDKILLSFTYPPFPADHLFRPPTYLRSWREYIGVSSCLTTPYSKKCGFRPPWGNSPTRVAGRCGTAEVAKRPPAFSRTKIDHGFRSHSRLSAPAKPDENLSSQPQNHRELGRYCDHDCTGPVSGHQSRFVLRLNTHARGNVSKFLQFLNVSS